MYLKKDLLYRIKNLFKRFGILVLVPGLGLSTYFLLNFQPGFKQMLTLATSVKPEILTELYFENHLSLPHDIQPNHLYRFAFTIHNVEQRDLNYNYEIILKDVKKTQMLSKHNVFVKRNDYKTITTSFTAPLQSGKSTMIVALPDRNQHIDFLINE